jgi:hypothetical protein
MPNDGALKSTLEHLKQENLKIESQLKSVIKERDTLEETVSCFNLILLGSVE